RVNFDLPETPVQLETRNLVYEIVNDYQKRGVTKEVIDQQKDRIYALASKGATGRVKASILFQEIATKEGIRVTDSELNHRVLLLAQHYDMTPQKFLKELQGRDGLQDVYREVLHEKVIDFLQEHARIEDVEPAAAASQ